jgi:hypothetical protein
MSKHENRQAKPQGPLHLMHTETINWGAKLEKNLYFTPLACLKYFIS